MQRGLRKGSAGPALKLAYQNGSGAGAGLAAGGTGSCMRPPQNLSNITVGTILGESCVGINRLQKNSSGFKSHLCVFVTLGFVLSSQNINFIINQVLAS